MLQLSALAKKLRISHGSGTRSTEAPSRSGESHVLLDASFPFESHSEYVYNDLETQLDQVRLFILLPSQDRAAPLRGSLTVVQRSSCVGLYVALSYAWGTTVSPQPLFVGQDVLKIGDGLALALHYLRDSQEAQILWIDAICINQASAREKSHQVRQMHQIYAQASRVLVWLGEPTNDTREAMELLNSSTRLTSIEKPTSSLRELYSRPWWGRVWVVQEIAAAAIDPLVICGDLIAPWRGATEAIVGIAEHDLGNLVQNRGFEDPVAMMQFASLRLSSEHWDLENLLLATSGHKASESRDHIYALLGIAKEVPIHAIRLDYTEPVERVYSDAMLWVLRSRRDLDWLVYATRGENPALSSWCIDFSKKAWQRRSFECHWAPRGSRGREIPSQSAPNEICATTGRTDFRIVHSPNGTLQLYGARVGRISTARPFTSGLSPSFQLADFYETATDWNRLRRRLDCGLHDVLRFTLNAAGALRSRLGSESAAAIIAAGTVWKICGGGLEFSDFWRNDESFQQPANGYAQLERYQVDVCRSWRRASKQWAHLLPPVSTFSEDTFFRSFFNIIKRAGNQCYFTTDTGYVGIAGDLPKQTDFVCILFTCMVPAIIRPLADGTFKLITFTYTHGIMQGEMLINNNNYREETFLLS